ncbi:protein-disulfide reductase DsbD family protein [Pedobacter sp.]|jgi:thiol:disulfide interchange protein|uniref:protein-disulfide reductase DsbD family protein n=1 Tax=Pedobacter sp. TaxID=1411316 RepID=UPI002C07C932|nr:cytochrome c biogenesis protein CcdA [Pedobacter sp.]HWW38349.1 cytochrome c biogenesis protein CcdA [Pedobacter sp.]
MKKLILVLGVIFSLSLVNSGRSFALMPQQDTTINADDIEFTEIGSSADSAKNDLKKEVAKADTVKKEEAVAPAGKTIPAAGQTEKEKTLWETFIAGLFGGFLAFLMPCIFPMVPLTISYFTKRSGSKQKGIGQALIYGLSIIVIYVAFGLLITALFGSAGLNAFSSSGWFNFLFFILLVVFAVSFFGAFEITLPSAIVNKIDQKADDSKGLGGIFFMAASLALVSFSCTGPIIGTLLVQASSKGEILAPAVGMFGFALALALPFTLSAVFPGFLSSMPKSGGWLNSVKVCLGFLELALALKFLSAADLAWHWEWFDREIFLVLWIVIFVLMGIYILGKIKFSHDSDVPYVSVPRLFFAIISLSFAMYLVPGLWGAPVNILSGIAPPMNTQDFILTGGGSNAPGPVSADFPTKVKHSEFLKPPVGFHPFFDLDEGLEYAKKVNKPILIDFTGHACVNCRKMEDKVWIDKEVGRLIRDEYVLIQLYVDERNVKMPKEKVHYSTILKHDTDDLGWWNGDFQATKYNTNSQPFYVLAGPDLNPLVTPKGAIFDAKEYAAYLQSGLDKFKAGK